jgi:hypothetical protein
MATNGITDKNVELILKGVNFASIGELYNTLKLLKFKSTTTKTEVPLVWEAGVSNTRPGLRGAHLGTRGG